MNHDLRDFIARFVGTSLLALMPVVFTAFCALPLSLSRHPGELAQVNAPAPHMT
jgi:hypothetical protein